MGGRAVDVGMWGVCDPHMDVMQFGTGGKGARNGGDCVGKQMCRVRGGSPGPDVTPHGSSLFSPRGL